MTAEGGHAVGPRIDGPDADGFLGVTFGGDGHNAGYGRMLARGEGSDVARVRVQTGVRSSNVRDTIHGGFLMSFLDQALFVGPSILGRLDVPNAVTLGVSTQFIEAGRTDRPLDAVVEIVRETGRLMFLRGVLEQGGATLLTYQATLRKFTPRAS